MASKIQEWKDALDSLKAKQAAVVTTSGRITISPSIDGVTIAVAASVKSMSSARDVDSITISEQEADFVTRTLRDLYTPK